MFLMAAVLEVAIEFLLGLLIEAGLFVFPGTGHLLAWLATGGRVAVRGGAAWVLGLAFWLLVGTVILFFALK